MSRFEACVVCGAEAPTRFLLIRWASGDPLFTAGPRCIDRKACRERVEAAGETWEVVEAVGDVARGRTGFSAGHRIVFEAARRWRERQASS